MSAFDATMFREALGHYPTGVVMVTCLNADGEPDGMVIGSFTSVSLDPPLVAFMPMKSSRSYARMKSAQTLCVNVLGANQEAVCRAFVSGQGTRFEDTRWSASPAGAPILDDAVAWFECSPRAVHDGGDHDIVVCEVTALGVQHQENPLLFFQGGYGRFSYRTLLVADRDLITAVQATERARSELQALADALRIEVNVMAASAHEMVWVASAVHPEVHARPVLGSRCPLIAPLGELHVAGRSEQEIDAWADRKLLSEDDRRLQLARLAEAGARGWSASMSGGRPEGELREALRRYTQHELTPSEHLSITREIASAAPFYPPFTPEPDGTYDLHSIMVAVPAESGPANLVIRLGQLPQGVTGDTIGGWVAATRRVAEIIADNARHLTGAASA